VSETDALRFQQRLAGGPPSNQCGGKGGASSFHVDPNRPLEGEGPQRQSIGRRKTEVNSRQAWLSVPVVFKSDACRWTIKVTSQKLPENSPPQDKAPTILREMEFLGASLFVEAKDSPKALQRSARLIQIRKPQLSDEREIN